jgi:glutathione S-transferase
MIRLYRIPFSTNVERVALALAHKGLEAEPVVIDPSDRREVERISGQRLVPVIDDDGTVVADSTAILEYLEERYPEPRLYPVDSGGRAEMRICIDWFNRVWKRPPNEIEAELLAPAPDERRIAELAAWMAEALELFEQLLAGRDYLLGNDFSAADCAAYPFLKYARGRDAGDDELFHRILEEHQRLESHPRLAAWIARIDERPRI